MAHDRGRRRMAALVRQWEQSTETRAAFAQRHGLSVATFDYWKRRVRRDASSAAAVTFAPVRVVADPRADAPSTGIDVVLASGKRLTVRGGVSVDLVRTVLSALHTC